MGGPLYIEFEKYPDFQKKIAEHRIGLQGCICNYVLFSKIYGTDCAHSFVDFHMSECLAAQKLLSLSFSMLCGPFYVLFASSVVLQTLRDTRGA